VLVDYTNKEKYFIPHGRLIGGGNCVSGVKHKNNPKQDTTSLENVFKLKQK